MLHQNYSVTRDLRASSSSSFSELRPERWAVSAEFFACAGNSAALFGEAKAGAFAYDGDQPLTS